MLPVSQHFNREELECRCGCGKFNVDLRLLERLELARGIARIPFRVNSCCRCENWNKQEGGLGDSAHLMGLAADLSARNGNERWRIIDALLRAGFVRIGVGQTFIHADVDESKPCPVIWTY